MSKMIQIRHVPDELHAKLKARAAAAGMTLTDYLLSELRLLADTPTLEELTLRVRQEDPIYAEESSADIIRRMRDAADAPGSPDESSADIIRAMREAANQ
jgi:antitoxin FitA